MINLFEKSGQSLKYQSLNLGTKGWELGKYHIKTQIQYENADRMIRKKHFIEINYLFYTLLLIIRTILTF